MKNINSDLPRSSFAEAELDRLADSILAADGLLRPLILQESGLEKYRVIDGHREYYAAVKAKEKDLSKAEMVNAFVIGANVHQAAIDQLELLKEKQASPPVSIDDLTIDRDKSTEPNYSSIIEQILPTLLNAIALQIQPIFSQLAEQKQILDLLKSDRQSTDREPETKDIPPELVTVAVQIPNQKAVEELESVKSTKSITKNKRTPKSKDSLELPLTTIQEISKLSDKKDIKAVKTTKSAPAKNKKNSNFIELIDPVKLNNTLQLINTLSQEQLILRMKRSTIPNAENLAINIIINRDTQLEQKFDTWETITAAKIGGLGEATIKKIIEKLK